MTTVVDAENEAIRVSLEYQKKIEAIQEKLENKSVDFIKEKMGEILSDLSHNSLREMFSDIDTGLTYNNLEAYSERLQDDWDKKKDAQEKLKRLYKIQMIGEALKYQNQFCPGGFNTEGEIGRNLQIHNEGLNKGIEELIKNTEVLVISNEALDMDNRNIPNTKMIKHAKKEYFSFSSKDGLETEPETVNETSKITIGEKTYYSQHLPSLKYEKREEASVDYFKNGGAFDNFLGSVTENFGGFAGDINLYPATFSDNSWKLRPSVLNILKKYNLVLFTAKHKINKNARARFQDQWHKVKEGGNTEPEFRSDSLIVVEPFDGKKEYERFATDNPNICVFLPSGEGSPIEVPGEIKEYQPFTFKDDNGKLLMITDHFVVKGTDISIFSGADADGKGLKPKKFIGLDPPPYVEADQDQQKMNTLNKMVKIINKINEFLEKFNTENLKDISAGGRRRKSNRRKSKRRKSKRRKSKRRKSKRRKSKRRKSKRRKYKR